MNNRLQQFLSAENLTQAQFADSINVARASISHILAGRNNPGYDFIINTMKRYPDLNVEWLLTGQGKMYKSRTREQKAPAQAKPYPVNLFDDYSDLEEPERQLQEPEAESGSITPPRADEGSRNASVQPKATSGLPAKESITLQESRISGQGHTDPLNIATTGDIAAAYGKSETAVRQRKAVKIVIFYDDNTFQEF